MVTRRLGLRFVASLCGLLCALALGVGSASAATRFGSTGSEAGQLQFPVGVAVDATGNVYVGDTANERIDKFDGAGNFSLAWGWEVIGGKLHQLQTCTTECVQGEQNFAAGAFQFPTGVAVDNDPLSSSYGDVYVVDHNNERVEKYDSTGKFLLMFGGHVNATTGGDVCVAGEACREGSATQGSADGEFSNWPSLMSSFIAVGPGGAIYVGDQARVQVFESSGVWKENISLASLSATGRPAALAVDTAGDVFVKDEEVAGVREIEPGGAEKGFQFDVGSTSVTSLALGSSGEVFVGDSNGGFHVLEYDSAGDELESFGSNTVLGGNSGMAFSETTKELYASQYVCHEIGMHEEECDSGIWVLTPPPAGPVVESELANPGLRGIATLEATVNPEGNETTYDFDYVDEAQYQSTGFAGATRTLGVSIGSGCPSLGSSCFESQTASAQLTGLVPGDTYHYRIVATDSRNHTTTGVDQTFETVPPARVEGPWASNVAGTSATLSARIDPLGASTSYRLEYGTSTSYEHVLSGNVGEGMGYVLVSYHEQELAPGTYHYRLVTTSEVGTVESTDRTFTTQGVGSELTLLDGRAWELVSPPNKEGSFIFMTGPTQAASDGAGITYHVNGVPFGEGISGGNAVGTEQVLSTRGPDGWHSQDLQVPLSTPRPGEPTSNLASGGASYESFSADLSEAVMGAGTSNSTVFPPEALEATRYLRNNITQSYMPFLTTGNVPAGTHSETIPEEATPDLNHFIFSSPSALTRDAVDEYESIKGSGEQLFEWDGGGFQLVNILPDGEEAIGHTLIAGSSQYATKSPIAMSPDGRWIAWTWGRPGDEFRGLYLRDMVAGRTVQVGGSGARYQTMSSDGSRIFFLEKDDLYEYDVSTGVQMNLTNDFGAGESSGGVREFVVNVSQDGSYVYFVATGVLAKGGVSGLDNLYLSHDVGGQWLTSFIATLSGEDKKDWRSPDPEGQSNSQYFELERITSRVSPDGRYFTFMSERSLTGYDNIDANSGQPDEEVYLYDADTGRLVCASCDPSGARPDGVLDLLHNTEFEKTLLVDPEGDWTYSENRWLAGNIPGWSDEGAPTYQSRYLLDGGRLFFMSPDALVPQDTNGLEDVYEYEPIGVGGCTVGGATFSARSGGCVDLISSGQSSSESAFYDASETGDDVFFITTARLSSEDYDTSYDMYDAHVCSASVPCTTSPVSPPPCSSGDSCKAAPSPQPAIFGPAPSATFSGIGNVIEEAKAVKPVKHKIKAKPKPKRHSEHKKRRGKKAGRSHTVKASRKGVR